MLEILEEVKRHPFATAAIASATAAAISILGRLPELAWKALLRVATVQLQADGTDPGYRELIAWLSRHPYAQGSRTMTLSSGRDEIAAVPGFGIHLLWEGGPLLIQRTTRGKDEPKVEKHVSWLANNPYDNEKMVITSLGRNRRQLTRLLEIVNKYQQDEDDAKKCVKTLTWGGHWQGWRLLARSPLRDISRIVLPGEVRDELVAHASWFFGAREWYATRDVPWRCGYLLKGPPGTGKTSVVIGLASRFDRPICVLNLAGMPDDRELMEAFLGVPDDAIVLIEDVDAVHASLNRKQDTPEEKKANETGASPPATPAPAQKGITLSGLLNAIDGVAAGEGRLLILTTNHPEKLDHALTRKARVDKEFEIGYLTPDLVEEMAARFFPDDPGRVAAWRSKAELIPLRAGAEWQAEFLDAVRYERGA